MVVFQEEAEGFSYQKTTGARMRPRNVLMQVKGAKHSALKLT